MDEMYANKTCKGLCTKLDDLGMCMGLCSTDTPYVQGVYDKHKAHAIKTGKPWEPIADFEKKPKNDVTPTSKNEDENVLRRGMR